MRACALLLLTLSITAHAHQPRSTIAKRDFQRANPCPSTNEHRGRCPGYVIDHVIALDCARTPDERAQLDQATNMQWQTIADGKAKDKWERKACAKINP